MKQNQTTINDNKKAIFFLNLSIYRNGKENHHTIELTEKRPTTNGIHAKIDEYDPYKFRVVEHPTS